MNKEVRERLLLYALTLIVGMLSWFLVHVWTEIVRISQVQSERKVWVEEVPLLREELKQLRLLVSALPQHSMELQRQSESLKRLEDRFYGRSNYGRTPNVIE